MPYHTVNCTLFFFSSFDEITFERLRSFLEKMCAGNISLKQQENYTLNDFLKIMNDHKEHWDNILTSLDSTQSN